MILNKNYFTINFNDTLKKSLWNQEDVYGLSKSVATWNGIHFVIDVSSYAIGNIIG